MVHRNPNRELGSDEKRGPYTVTRVNDNGTLRLKEDTNNGGAVYQTSNMEHPECESMQGLITLAQHVNGVRCTVTATKML